MNEFLGRKVWSKPGVISTSNYGKPYTSFPRKKQGKEDVPVFKIGTPNEELQKINQKNSSSLSKYKTPLNKWKK